MERDELYEKSLKTIELPAVLELLAEKAASDGAKEAARALRPLKKAMNSNIKRRLKMKARYIFGILLVLLMATTACAYAAEATLDDYKFTTPDKYNVDKQSDDYFDLKMDDSHMISIAITDDVTSDADTIKALQAKGDNVTGNQTFTYNGKQISEIKHNNGAAQYYIYTWKLDDDDYAIVAYGIPLSEGDVDWNSSPVKVIFDSIKKVD